jgi:hypothetical protein
LTMMNILPSNRLHRYVGVWNDCAAVTDDRYNSNIAGD